MCSTSLRLLQFLYLYFLDDCRHFCCFKQIYPTVLLSVLTDDGSGPDKIAHIMGPPDQCQHAASIITDLLQSIRAREEGGQGVSTSDNGVELI